MSNNKIYVIVLCDENNPFSLDDIPVKYDFSFSQEDSNEKFLVYKATKGNKVFNIKSNTYISIVLQPNAQKGHTNITNEVSIYEKKNSNSNPNTLFKGNIPTWDFFDTLIHSTLEKKEEDGEE